MGFWEHVWTEFYWIRKLQGSDTGQVFSNCICKFPDIYISYSTGTNDIRTFNSTFVE